MTSLLDYRQIRKMLDTSLSHINFVDSVLSFKAAKVVLDHEIKNAITKEREILDTGSKGQKIRKTLEEEWEKLKNRMHTLDSHYIELNKICNDKQKKERFTYAELIKTRF